MKYMKLTLASFLTTILVATSVLAADKIQMTTTPQANVQDQKAQTTSFRPMGGIPAKATVNKSKPVSRSKGGNDVAIEELVLSHERIEVGVVTKPDEKPTPETLTK